MLASATQLTTQPRFRPEDLAPSTPATRPEVAPGVATVIEAGPRPQVAVDGELVELLWALPYGGELQVGDAVQVLRQGARCYAVGVLRSAGRFRWTLSDVAQLRALRLRLRGDRGVKLLAPDVRVKARRLVVEATEVAERLGGAARRVLGRLTVRAKQARTVVSGEYQARVKQRRGVAAEAHRLDGGLVQFGQ